MKSRQRLMPRSTSWSSFKRRPFDAFPPLRIEPLPYSTAICGKCARRGWCMEITIHKHLIEQCVMMACASKADRDKALWLTMAQSWGRLADEVERSEMAHA